ncbi:transcription elongation factor B polypeptide 1 [Penicillium chermesinum]|uniref:E3 ubiquitin ligase complex SCF subunit sconC n=1 Tax=Penicillium chermesinum TaxID=63820 RepID=A0A9W9TS25_9EURO|nr:transcription elongation factor B polypeptide 1 [Penicillium chermesinum]KAJ5239107.1 transcription elongation factor B polypeptide 1 [Penicillium chermesinum]KAJ6164747.1 transcription elongation factor B polypeptide 1 [Penicillium chermesinum]
MPLTFKPWPFLPNPPVMADPALKYVTLVSRDGFEFILEREQACVSGTISRMLDPKNGFVEAITGRCVFENINGVILQLVCEYFLYNHRHRNELNVEDMELPLELCLEVLMAADYLDC